MAESWHSIVDEEIAHVDDVMKMEVRSAYPELNRMCEDTLSSRYHSVRPALCILSYHANGGKDSETAVNTASCLESVFEGLHLHDRVDSNGNIVGMKKKMFSKPPSTTKIIVAGDFMYVMGFRLAYGKVPKVVPYLMQASASISDAIFKITDLEHDTGMTEEDCFEVLKKKSAIEYQILMECAAKQADVSEERLSDMRECGMHIGMALQLESELEELFGGKEEPSSVKAGYPMLAVYYSMQDASYGQKIKDLFSQKDMSQKDAEHIVRMMGKTDAESKCRKLVAECMAKASEIASRLPDSEYKSAILAFIEGA